MPLLSRTRSVSCVWHLLHYSLQLLTQIGNWDGRGVIAFTAAPSWRRTRTESIFFVEYQWTCSRYRRNITRRNRSARHERATARHCGWECKRMELFASLSAQKSIAHPQNEQRISCCKAIFYSLWFHRSIL